jgi:WD40 repeat protein
MTFEYAGDLRDKQIVCKFCNTAYDVPDSFKRVTTKRTRRGLLRGVETVEEVTEMRSDFPIAEQPAPPRIVQIALSGLPTAAPVTSQPRGCSIGAIIFFLIIASIILIPIVITIAATSGGLSDALSDVGLDVGQTETIEAARALQTPDSSFMSYVAYSPDGRFIAAGSFSHMTIWNTETGLITGEIDFIGANESVSFTADGQQVITGGMGDIVFYDTSSGQYERSINGLYYSSVAHGPYIAAAANQGSLQLLGLESGEVIRTFDSDIFYVQQLIFSPDGRYLVAGGNENNLGVWEVETGREIFKGKANALSVDKMAFSPDNQTLVLGDSDKLEFYEVVNGGFRYVKTKTITNDMFSAESLAFSPDGKNLAIGDFFGEAVIWNLDDEKVIYKLSVEDTDSVRPVAFSPDGTRVAGAGLQDSVYEWVLPTD